MKSLLILLAAGACLSGFAFAQSPATARAPAAAAAPTPAAPAAAVPASTPVSGGPAAASVPLPGQPSGPTLEKALPLMPETAPGGYSTSTRTRHSNRKQSANAAPGSGAADNNTFSVEKDIRARILMRDAETRVLANPALQQEWAAAHQAHTDPRRRALLTKYYNDLYDGMIKLQPAIADRINIRRQAAIQRMHYARLGDDYDPAGEDIYSTTRPATNNNFGPNPPSDDIPPAL